MSGLEFLLAVPVAAALGYRQHQQDNEELVGFEDLPQLREVLRKVQESVDSGHSSLTTVWGTPLSLFSKADETSAEEQGVPAWAVASIRMGQRLVDEAAELRDMTDVYEAQLLVAEREDNKGRGVLRSPVLTLIGCLEELAPRFAAQVSCLILARDAFDRPADAPGDDPTVRFHSSALPAEWYKDLPIKILRGRGRLGELWAVGEALNRVLARHGETASESPELSPWVLSYLEPADDAAMNPLANTAHKQYMEEGD